MKILCALLLLLGLSVSAVQVSNPSASGNGNGGSVTNFGVAASGPATTTTNGTVVTVNVTAIANINGIGTNTTLKGPTNYFNAISTAHTNRVPYWAVDPSPSLADQIGATLRDMNFNSILFIDPKPSTLPGQTDYIFYWGGWTNGAQSYRIGSSLGVPANAAPRFTWAFMDENEQELYTHTLRETAFVLEGALAPTPLTVWQNFGWTNLSLASTSAVTHILGSQRIVMDTNLVMLGGNTITGNGAGLTNIPNTSITGGRTTNITFMRNVLTTNTMYFTNGVLGHISDP